MHRHFPKCSASLSLNRHIRAEPSQASRAGERAPATNAVGSASESKGQTQGFHRLGDAGAHLPQRGEAMRVAGVTDIPPGLWAGRLVGCLRSSHHATFILQNDPRYLNAVRVPFGGKVQGGPLIAEFG